MLKITSFYWPVKNKESFATQLQKVGFKVEKSRRNPSGLSVFFGPESIELTDVHQDTFILELESDDISSDYKRLKASGISLDKPRRAIEGADNIPLWTDFALPPTATPLMPSLVMMSSPASLKDQSLANLPLTHSNGCFGVEGYHLLSPTADNDSAKWGALLENHVSQIQWTELDRTQGKRIQAGEKFLDFLTPTDKLLKLNAGHTGLAMVTLKVNDIERCRKIFQDANMKPIPCHNRDGFTVRFESGPTFRFVRAFWKKYLPHVGENYPLGRRTDKFRPLGGANSSTLSQGFEDNWDF